MKVISILILSLFLLNSTNAQTLEKLDPNEKVIINGIEVKKGDFFYVLEPVNFKKKYTSIFTDKKLNYNKLRVYQVYDETYNYSYKKIKIANMKKNVSNGKIVATDGFGIRANYIDIALAIELQEIVTTEMYNKTNKKSDVFTDELAFTYFVKLLESKPDKYFGDFLYAFNYDTYRQTHNDEFEFFEAISLAGNKLKEASSNFNEEQDYSLFTSTELSAYNFSTQSFNLQDLESGAFTIYRKKYSCDCQLDRINLEFENIESFIEIEVGIEKAKSFISSRKNSYGSINREVYLEFTFSFNRTLNMDDNKATLLATIKEMKVYANDDFKGGMVAVKK